MGFFDYPDRLKSLSSFGDPLERLSEAVDFEVFRPTLEQAFSFKADQGQGGRPPYDCVLIF